jgi:uncharacterized membrane protein YeaQ/YmgE (transglycosylase-associated protein family)
VDGRREAVQSRQISLWNRHRPVALIAPVDGGRHEYPLDYCNILWIIVIGFVAGIVARFLAPGPNNPQGFILTTILGIVGAFLATFIGQAVGWYRLDQGAGLIGAVVGAVVVLFV